MALHDQIDNLLKVFTEKQRELFARNINLWEKTTELNRRLQHFDSFDVDSCMLMHEWDLFIEDIKTSEFDSTTSPTMPADKYEIKN